MALDSWVPLTRRLFSWEDKAELLAQRKPRQGGMRGDQRPRATDCLTSEEAQKASPSVVKRNSSSLGPVARALARVSCRDQLRPFMQPLGCDCEVSGCSGQPFSSTSSWALSPESGLSWPHRQVPLAAESC